MTCGKLPAAANVLNRDAVEEEAVAVEADIHNRRGRHGVAVVVADHGDNHYGDTDRHPICHKVHSLQSLTVKPARQSFSSVPPRKINSSNTL